jgi:carbamoyltransferase
MLILGLNAFHPDSAACVLRDGKLVAAVAEERLGKRLKHVAGFPGRAVNEVLRMAGASLRDVDFVARQGAARFEIAAEIRAGCGHAFPAALPNARIQRAGGGGVWRKRG